MNTLQTIKPANSQASDRFRLNDPAEYADWRAHKLRVWTDATQDLWVDIADPGNPTHAEIDAITTNCHQANMAFYRSNTAVNVNREAIKNLTIKLGMRRLDANLCADNDSISSIQVMQTGRRAGYIPYTNRPLNWHTDGYYNSLEQPIRSFLMHCIRPAATGGENRLLDTNLAYIMLRDANPEYSSALMHPQAMTIPANIENGQQLRPDQSGPVFYIDKKMQTLSMRYTARTRNITWRDDTITREAVEYLQNILTGENPFIITVRLGPGEGIICNNVLHCRSAFSDEPDSATQRLLYRARSYDRIAAKGLMDLKTN